MTAPQRFEIACRDIGYFGPCIAHFVGCRLFGIEAEHGARDFSGQLRRAFQAHGVLATPDDLYFADECAGAFFGRGQTCGGLYFQAQS